MIRVTENLRKIRDLLAETAENAGRNRDSVKLLAVSKKQPITAILEAVSAGQRDFGENQVQEGIEKVTEIGNPKLTWHFIGHLQTNKTKLVPGHFDWLHTLDSLRLARRLSGQALNSASTLNVLLQVNIASDPDKFGLPPAEVSRFVDELLKSDLAGIRLRGLMTIGRRDATPGERRRDFTALRELGNDCARRFGAELFSELSMGMSSDFETAITEGATMVRVGSSIFGQRPAPAARVRSRAKQHRAHR